MSEVNAANESTAKLTKQQMKNKKKREAAKLKKKQGKEEFETTATTSPCKDTSTTKGEQNEAISEIADDNYEEELAWCIHQLELGLNNQKATKDQQSKASKLISQFRSAKVAKPKKRLLMRQTFGDYRDKMMKEKQAVKPGKPPVLTGISKEEITGKGKFIKTRTNQLPDVFKELDGSNVFKFNFPDPT